MLKGKVAIVTGSTSGIGLGIARTLAAQGADLILNGFGDAGEIEALRSGLAREHNVRVAYDGADMSDGTAVRGLIAATVQKLGRLDILVNNAGIQFTAPVTGSAPAGSARPWSKSRLPPWPHPERSAKRMLSKSCWTRSSPRALSSPRSSLAAPSPSCARPLPIRLPARRLPWMAAGPRSNCKAGGDAFRAGRSKRSLNASNARWRKRYSKLQPTVSGYFE